MKFSSFAPALASFPGAAEGEVYTQQVALIAPSAISHSQSATDLVLHSPGRIIYLEVRAASDSRILGYIVTSDAIGAPHVAVYTKGSLADLSPSQRLQLIARASDLLLTKAEYEKLFIANLNLPESAALIAIQQAIVNRLLEV